MLWEVLLPALLMGFSFPLGNAIIQRSQRSVGRRAGTGGKLRWTSLKAPAGVAHRTRKPMAKKTPKAATPKTQEDTAKAGKLSALDAAAKVLQESGQPMNCQEMIQAMATASGSRRVTRWCCQVTLETTSKATMSAALVRTPMRNQTPPAVQHPRTRCAAQAHAILV